MTRPPQIALTLTLVALGGSACSRPCDRDGLARVVETLEATDRLARNRGIQALTEACASIPDPLVEAVVATYGELPADRRAQLVVRSREDPGYRQLVHEACPKGGLPSGSSTRVQTWAACGFERYGLLDENEPFIVADQTGFVLYEWLLDNRNDPALARAAVRGFLWGTGTRRELARRCMEEGDTCFAVLGGPGSRLPTSSSDLLPTVTTVVAITPTELRVDGEAVVELRGGAAVDDDAAATHIIEPLRDRLVARGKPAEGETTLTVAADRDVPMGAVLDAFLTAHEEGFTTLDLAVDTKRGVHAIRMDRPRSWDPGPQADAPAPRPRVTVGRERIELRASEWDERPPAEVDLHAEDLAAVLQAARARGLGGPRTEAVRVDVDPAVTVADLVAVLDALRGPRCSLQRLHDGRDDDDCRRWATTLDANPTLSNHLVRWTRFRLSDPTFSGHGRPVYALTKQRIHETKDDLRDCLKSDPLFRAVARRGDEVVVTIGPSPEGGWAASTTLPGAIDAPACLEDALGLSAPDLTTSELSGWLAAAYLTASMTVEY